MISLEALTAFQNQIHKQRTKTNQNLFFALPSFKQKRDAQLNQFHPDGSGRRRLRCDDELLVLRLSQFSAAQHKRREQVFLCVGILHPGARKRFGRVSYHLNLADGHPRNLAIHCSRVRDFFF